MYSNHLFQGMLERIQAKGGEKPLQLCNKQPVGLTSVCDAQHKLRQILLDQLDDELDSNIKLLEHNLLQQNLPENFTMTLNILNMLNGNSYFFFTE